MSSSITSALSPKPGPPERRSRRKKYVAIGLLLYAVVGFFVVPPIIKWQLHKQLPTYTHRQATVKQVRVNPFALSLTVRGLALTETNGTPFAGFDELYVNFQLSSLFRWAWTFRDIKVVRPTVNIVCRADGQFNFSDLLTNRTPSDKPFTLPPALIQRLNITNAALTFTDHTTPTPFHTVYGPTHIELENLSTRPNQYGPYSIVAKTDEGEAFRWSGTVSLNPPQSRGEVELLNIPPAKYAPYLAHFTTMRVANGKLDVSAAYAIKVAGFPPEIDVSNALVRLRDFRLKAPEADETLLALDDVLVQDASANLRKATARVPLVKLSGGSAFVRREADGGFEAEKYVQVPTNAFVQIREIAAELQQAINVPLSASLDELRVENFSLAAEDHSLPTVARLGVDHVNVTVKGVSNQTNAPFSIKGEANWRGGGRVQVSSTGTLLPLMAEASLAVSNLALAPVQPYVEPHANLTLQSGALNVGGSARLDHGNTHAPFLEFTGDVSVANFLSSDTIAYQEFVSWENLGVRGIDFKLEPTSAVIEEVKLTRLRANVAVSSNGQPSVLALFKDKPAASAPPAVSADNAIGTNTPAPAFGLFPIKLGALVLEHGSLSAMDESVSPRLNTSVEEFNGSVRDITFPGLTRATIDIRGKVSTLSPFSVVGTLTPDLANPFADVTITFTNTDLTPLTPYSEKFAGYPLNKGKLAFLVHYHVENRQVKGENAVTVDQLTFGAHNNSPHATKLPVKLGVALLKDRDGRIVLDVPVSGSLDDPSFKIGGVVWKVIVNTLVKAATSPFSLLGALVGGGEEMQFVEFEPGVARLGDNQTNKLAKLTKALYERPALNLEIGATYDAGADQAALGRQKVLEKMMTLRIQEIVARGRPAPPLDQVVLEDDEYDRLLRKAYREAFNTTPEQALRESLAAALNTNAPGTITTTITRQTEPSGQGKGAVALMQKGKSLAELHQQASGTASTGKPPGKPMTERELIRDELERRLMTIVPVTENDALALLQRRIASVQQFLIDAGGISPERLFPVAPKAAAAAKGEPRVVFTLN
ncbi:MAG TPA: DUF748 domain-containing protein [Verrucomicrobiae bacterium]|nr:DUF748 domain-containing protein [Verrucomicrobiae bacterium]